MEEEVVVEVVRKGDFIPFEANWISELSPPTLMELAS